MRYKKLLGQLGNITKRLSFEWLRHAQAVLSCVRADGQWERWGQDHVSKWQFLHLGKGAVREQVCAEKVSCCR